MGMPAFIDRSCIFFRSFLAFWSQAASKASKLSSSAKGRKPFPACSAAASPPVPFPVATFGRPEALDSDPVQAANAMGNRREALSAMAGTPITWIVAGLALLLQAAVIYLPFLNPVFGTVALPMVPALAALGLGAGLSMASLKLMR